MAYHEFWQQYIEAGELEQLRLLETLPLLKDFDKKTGIIKNVTFTTIRGYLEDLIDTLKETPSHQNPRPSSSP